MVTSSVVKTNPTHTPPTKKGELIHILLVDDELGLLKTTKQILESIGPFQVETVLSVKEAMKKLEETEFDVIVSDYQMPEKDGLDFLRELREKGNNIPLILFTGKGREEIAIEALNLGASRYCNKIGKPQTVYGELSYSIQEAVEKRKAEKALLQEQEIIEAITQNVGVGITLISKDYHILWANHVVKELFGDVEGKICYRTYHNLTNVCARCGVKEILEKSKKRVVHDLEVQLNGQTSNLEIISTPIRDEKGNITAVAELSVDITERKQTEKALEAAKSRFETYLSLARVIMVALDAEGTITYVNKRFCEVFGCGEEEILGKNWFSNVIPTRIIPKTEAVFRKLMSGDIKPVERYENPILTKRGEERLISWQNTLLKDENGKIVGTLSSGEDVTERKKAEKALRESAEKYRELINAMNDTAWVIGFDGKFIDVNDAAVKVLGYSKDELLSMGPTDIDNTLPAGEIKDLINGMKTDEIQVFETAHTTKDGKKIPVEISSSRVTYQGKQAILSIARNITERKLLEKALQESEERFKQVSENSVEWIWEVDVDGLYTYSSLAVEKLLGYKPEELVGKMHFYDLFSSEERENLKKAAFSVFNEKESFRDFINRNVHKNGDDVWLSTSGVPMVDDEGKLVGYRGADVDITDRKQAEEAVDAVVNELEKVIEKLRVVGKATRHDVRNKLTVIANNVYLAKQSLSGGHDVSEYLDGIESTIGQVEKIFDFSKTYEMIGVEERSYVDVEKSVKEAAMLFSGLGVTKLETECYGLTVLADSQLRQLFYNLIDNSVKHGKKVTKIRVHYEEKGDLLKLIYEDDGVGIPESEKELIFKEDYGKGTGYGLYLIQKICGSYGWTIRETGTPGKGAQFTITVQKRNENWMTSR